MKKILYVLLLVFTPFFLLRSIFAAEGSVCIDPGHGGSDIGSVNTDILEKDLNLDVANRLAVLATQSGIAVFQTRTDDQTLSNRDRYTFCNQKRASILVSIHHNGSSDPATDFSMALYMKKSDVDLSRSVVNALSAKLGTTNAGISRFASGVLLKSKMPATISEGYFLTSSYEYELLHSTTIDRRQDEAQGLLDGILSYFSTH